MKNLKRLTILFSLANIVIINFFNAEAMVKAKSKNKIRSQEIDREILGKFWEKYGNKAIEKSDKEEEDHVERENFLVDVALYDDDEWKKEIDRYIADKYWAIAEKRIQEKAKLALASQENEITDTPSSIANRFLNYYAELTFGADIVSFADNVYSK